MQRTKPNSHYLMLFTLYTVLGYILSAVLRALTGIGIPSLIIPMLSATIITTQFIKNEKRVFEKEERLSILNMSLLIVILINSVFMLLAYFTGVFSQFSELFSDIGTSVIVASAVVGLLIYTLLQYLVLRLGYSTRFTKAAMKKYGIPPTQSAEAGFSSDGPEEQIKSENWGESPSDNSDSPAPAQSSWQPVNDDSWQPVNDGGAALTSGGNLAGGYTPGAERAPWLKWLLSFVLLATVAAAALWLISQTIVSDDLPADRPRFELPTGETKTEEAETPPKSADEQAWIDALEKDTLQGYREYLEAFPNGRYKEKAQEEINAYDNKAWENAERRNTIAGYEEYLANWPEGLHAPKAKERIAEMKAAIEAARKDAAERAAREARAWEVAEQGNSIQSYQDYLGQYPSGKNAPTAQERIARMQAEMAAAEASAIEEAAWSSAKSSNTVAGYETYLSSYPSGKYAPLAKAALEELKPSPGKTFRDCDVCPLMVTVPGGNANLGAGESEAGAKPNEKPQRPVIFGQPFSIGVTEVTFAQYEACVTAGGCTARPNDNGWGGGKRPVINVSWDDAQKYAGWLSSKTGKNYSLPSEAQWEYAARGGDTGLYAGGSKKALCAFANGAGTESGLGWANSECNDLSSDRTLPAGSLSGNKYGLKDMIGNVAEWTLDCNTLNLKDAPTDGSADLRGSCNQRSVRGGSWFSGPVDLRYSTRLMQRRGDSNDFTGFRVVRQ